MIPLINVDDIIRKHFQTLKEDANLFYRVLYFLIIPLIVAGAFLYFHKYLDESIITSLITAFSIFIGLLLNIILVIFAIVNGSTGKLSTLKSRLLEHLYANSIYTLLLSTILIIILLLMLILNDWTICLLVIVFSFVVYFGVTHFIMTLLMIFKRLYVLLFD
jgi:hypothetical protein